MKKIYSIVLMAAALFMGTNAMAVQVPVSNFAGLQSAFTSHLTDAEETIEIQLNGNIDMDATATTIYVRDGKHYVVDLNGNNITASFAAVAGMGSSPSMFYVVHGTLEFKNSGEADGTHGVVQQNLSGKEAFVISMSGAGYTYTKNQDNTLSFTEMPNVTIPNIENWSNLIVGKGVSLKTTASVSGGKAVTIYNLGANCVFKNNTPVYDKKGNLKASNYSKQYKRDLIVDPATGAAGLKIYDNGSEIDYVTTKGANDQSVARGVTVLVKEGATVYGGEYGVQISGVIGYQDNSDYRPVITIEGGATVQSSSAAKSTAVYAAGYGVINIAGEVEGATGVYIKGGEVNISGDAKITSNAESYLTPEPKSSGVNASGSAIVYETNPSYVGDIKINVTGNSIIGSENGKGYAIEGSQPVAVDPELKVLNVQGGTIIAGEEGTMEPNALQEAINQGATFEVNGATIQTDATDVQNINTLLELAGQSQIIAQEDNGSYVIENKPAGAEIKPDGTVNQNNVNAFVEWNTKGKEETVDGDREVGYLSMSENSKLTIPAGKTLKAGSIVMHSTAVIDIQAGGKLVLTDVNGLVANKTTNIKIAYQGGVSGLFYLSPDAKANKNPSATVELNTTKAYKDGNKYIYERLGMPAYNGMKVNDIVSTLAANKIAAIYWNDGWKVLSKDQNVAPFTGLAITTQETTPGVVLNFPCNLMGNANADLNVAAKWSYFANSYMANVDLKAFAQELASIADLAGGVYLDPQGVEKWNTVSLESLIEGTADATELKPMQGFILNRAENAAATAVTIDYKTMVWNPAFVPSNKVARNRAIDENLTRVKITVTNENGVYDNVTLRQSDKYSADRDNSADMNKYMSAVGANLYAVSNELGNMAEIATDNIDGMILGVSANKNEACKMTFSHVCGEQMAIRDNLTGATITMVEGAEYFFTASEGDNANRFEIIAVKNAPTDVETVVETTGAKAVYTVLGQYMGTTDNWNTLPNGIYVVDGVKMVK